MFKSLTSGRWSVPISILSPWSPIWGCNTMETGFSAYGYTLPWGKVLQIGESTQICRMTTREPETKFYNYSGTSCKGHLWNKDSSLIRTIILVPMVSVLERFHCITGTCKDSSDVKGPTSLHPWQHVCLSLTTASLVLSMFWIQVECVKLIQLYAGNM